MLDQKITSTHKDLAEDKESGKLGMAFLMWLLGVPGLVIVAYLLLAN